MKRLTRKDASWEGWPKFSVRTTDAEYQRHMRECRVESATDQTRFVAIVGTVAGLISLMIILILKLVL